MKAHFFKAINDYFCLDVPGKRNEVFYDCCPDPYLDITFYIKIRRRNAFVTCF